jgi:HEAT repeat protein
VGLLGTRKPNVKALARSEDVPGLIAAAAYQDRIARPNGRAADAGASVREEAIRALGTLGPEAGNGTVSRALRDPSEHVRAAAVRVLYSRAQVGDLTQALGWLPHSGPARRLAMQAILNLHPPGTARAVARGLAHAAGEAPVTEEDFALLHTLIHAEDSSDVANEVVDELLAALADEREAVGDRAEVLLTRLAPASTEGVIAELQAGAAPDRAAAILGRIQDNRALEPLVDAVRHPDPSVRAGAAEALGALRDTAAVEPLLHATRDPDFDVRASAGAALDQLGTAAVVVGMSALIRPAILEAAREERPALPESHLPSEMLDLEAALREARHTRD